MASQTQNSKPKALRLDARRNEDAILEAAKSLFMEKGVNVPVREIASQAGVGIGTTYRRFPKRSDLITAVFKREVDACAQSAEELLSTNSPTAALSHWLKQYAEFIATKKGMAEALHSGDQAYQALPDYFRAKFEPALSELLAKAALAGEMRDDIPAFDILRAIGNLSVAQGEDSKRHINMMIDLLIDGLCSMKHVET
ncbi:TetR/AcrR family transcriptional regulator [Polycladidibacter stylochi]|uniref:TetR/AcrR family transcriptional regulator n=1 Tax=Polycladidibacter stylochi TaxID=1807766 RepID=UPI000ACF3C31|nr:TetR/AcrR family transcriptional regulator [Pseudovibrio stylochi]